MDLGPYEYIVVRIDGDYAVLQRTDAQAEEKLVARALLPPETGEGSRLHYECLEYTIV
ncbi:MAG: chorismate--pyruvate lyase [Lachnospiraceae bacterium]|nr:chorismate--pyruvate lyase [Lachnospiraceae bacterium]